MATIDDVYNLLTDGAIGLGAINTHVGQVGAAVGWGTVDSAIDILRAQLEPPSGGTNMSSELSRLYSLLGAPGGTIYDWLDPSNSAGPAGQIADLHNLYAILVSGFPSSVDAGLIPDDSFYVIIYKAVHRTWES